MKGTLDRPWVLVSLAWFVLCSAAGLYPSGREAALAQQDLQAGRPGEAAGHLAEAASGRPWHTGWWEAAGRLALQGGEPGKAVEWLEMGRRREGLSIEGLTDLGEAYRQGGQFEAALHAWDAAEAQGMPEDALAQRRLEAHRALRDWDGIISDLQVLASQQTRDGQLHFELGLTLAARDPQASLAPLAQAGELDPGLKSATSLLVGTIRTAQLAGDKAYTLLGAGRALASLSEWSLAAEAFRQATQARPDYAEAWAYLGEARQHLAAASPSKKTAFGCSDNRQPTSPAEIQDGRGPVDQARADLERAAALDTESLAAQLFLSVYWQRRNCPALALEAIQAAAHLAPENPAVQVDLGNIRAASGDLPGAQEAYETAVRLAPKDPLYWQALAIFTLNNDVRVREVGLPAAFRAILLAPQDPAGLDVMAQILLELNDPLEARRFLERALEIRPDYAPAWLHLGWVHLLEGDRQAARQQFQQAIVLDPSSPAAEQARRSLENYFP